jgi:hypothetical protein
MVRLLLYFSSITTTKTTNGHHIYNLADFNGMANKNDDVIKNGSTNGVHKYGDSGVHKYGELNGVAKRNNENANQWSGKGKGNLLSVL